VWCRACLPALLFFREEKCLPKWLVSLVRHCWLFRIKFRTVYTDFYGAIQLAVCLSEFAAWWCSTTETRLLLDISLSDNYTHSRADWKAVQELIAEVTESSTGTPSVWSQYQKSTNLENFVITVQYLRWIICTELSTGGSTVPPFVRTERSLTLFTDITAER